MIRSLLFLLGAGCLVAGCSRTGDNTTGRTAPAGTQSASDSAENVSGTSADGAHMSTEISQAETSVQQGAYDDAAAQLVKLQMSGKSFSNQDAAAYRRAMGEAYSRALEAAEKGDARAQAALQLLKGARQ